MEEIGKKIKKEEIKKEIILKEEEIKFEDLPKKTQKKILRGDFLKCRSVQPSPIENGTFEILKLIKENPGITRLKLIELSKFLKKKIKRILKHSSIMLNKKSLYTIEKYYYVGEKLL